MITPQESIKSTLAAIFSRKGGSGLYTKRFDEFDITQQQELLEGLEIDQDELLVVAGKAPSGNRLIITTKRILQCENNVWSFIAAEDIAEVIPEQFGATRKSEMERLVLKTKEGIEKTVITESGKPHFGIWNLLLNIVARNRVSS